MNALERKIQLEIEEKLRARGWYVYRAVFYEGRGHPDDTAHKGDRCLEIEVKQPGGELSPQQQQYIARMAEVGSRVIVAESWEDVEPYAN